MPGGASMGYTLAQCRLKDFSSAMKFFRAQPSHNDETHPNCRSRFSFWEPSPFGSMLSCQGAPSQWKCTLRRPRKVVPGDSSKQVRQIQKLNLVCPSLAACLRSPLLAPAQAEQALNSLATHQGMACTLCRVMMLRTPIP